MKRREALNKIFLGGTTVFLVPATLSSCEKEDPDSNNNNNNTNDDIIIDLSDSANNALTSEGGYLVKSGVIIINTGNDNFIALSSVCTHNGCTVGYVAANDNLLCPCHDSVFSLDGTVLQGPASSPLKTYNVKKEGDILTIS